MTFAGETWYNYVGKNSQENEVIIINLFNIMPEEFFKPLASKYKVTFIDCLRLIYNTYKTELSFGVDKDVILDELENYFDDQSSDEMVFDEDENAEIAKDARAKANVILRRLKECGWLEYEIASDYKINVNLFDYTITMIESFNKIINNEEIEYQSLVSQIHGTLLNTEAYAKPYEYIIKLVIQNTEELIGGLKKLNTNIKKHIEGITNEKTAGEIIQDFFVYHKEIGSKAYHRIKTSENISHFRTAIIERLYYILDDPEIFNKAIIGYMEIEQVEEGDQAEETLKEKILNVIFAFRKYDEIISEIDSKNTKYMGSAVARAKFLLSNTNNIEGKISTILAYMAEEFNQDSTVDLYDDVDDELLAIFNIFPQGFIDNDSLYTIPISRKMYLPEEFSLALGLSEEEREIRKLALQEKNQNRFSRKNINAYINELLKNQTTILASTLPLESKRDLIRIVFINLYGNHDKSTYKITKTNEAIEINQFRFPDFLIERGEA